MKRRRSVIHVADLAIVLSAGSAFADETWRLSNDANGKPGNATSFFPSVSGDGVRIVFRSAASNLVPNDSNRAWDCFLFDRAEDRLTRISVSSSGAQGNDSSGDPVISADGRFVVFWSQASNLDVDPNGSIGDIFLHDVDAGTTRLVTHDVAGGGTNGGSNEPSISRDGQWIAFLSGASDLVSGDTNHVADVFVYDVGAGTVVRASTDSTGAEADAEADLPTISGDGRVVIFRSFATNFPGATGGGLPALYAKNLATGALERVDVDSSGVGVDDPYLWLDGISDDGNLATFTTDAALVSDDRNSWPDVYLRDRASGTTERVSVSTGGGELVLGARSGGLSRDGRFVIFTSRSSDVAPNDTNQKEDVFSRDRAHGVTLRVSRGSFDEEGSDSSRTDSVRGSIVSEDGKVVVFSSVANELAPGDGRGLPDVFVRVRCDDPSWTHYGSGFPGRNGVVPTMTPRDDPYRGGSLTIDLTNSSQLYTVGLLFVGLVRDSTPTSLGGTLLVDPVLAITLALTPFGLPIVGDLPDAWWSCALAIDLQAIELDPFAAEGVSFTDGLELVLGD